jgi:xanthine dehydrogenase YagS FAD-binding subunit
MKTFEMALPRTVEEATKLLPTEDTLAARSRVVLLAGGQDLLGELKDHLIEPERVVNLKQVPGLDGLDTSFAIGKATIGALVTLERLEHDAGLRTQLPMVAEAAEAVGSPQIRSVATVGGNLCQRPRCLYYRSEHAKCLKKGGSECFSYAGHNKYNAILGGGPSYIVHPSDLAPALVAADATIELSGPQGARSMPLSSFFVLPSEGDPTRETILAPNEIVTGVALPDRRGWRSTFLKVRERDQFDFALSAVALALRFDGVRVSEARLVLGGVAPVPWRCSTTEKLLVGRTIDADTCRAAGVEALRGAEPLAHNGYKIPMTRGLITKALMRLRP